MIFDMPLNSHPACTSYEAIAEKLRVANSRQLWVDVGLIGGMIPGNLETLSDQVRSPSLSKRYSENSF